jgi:hypothetical protein
VELGRVPVDLVPGGAVQLRIENWKDLEDGRVFTGPVEDVGGDAPVATVEAADPAAAAGIGDDAEATAREAPAPEPWRPDASQPVPAPAADGTILLEGLTVGPRRFEVRRGDWWRDGDLYGRARCVVVASETVEVSVPTSPSPARRIVVLAGEVVVPEEWGPMSADDPPTLEVRGLDPANATIDLHLRAARPGDDRTLAFPAKPVPTGRYQVQVRDYGWSEKFDLTEESARPRWTIPAPATFRIRIVDAASQEAIGDARFRAHGPDDVLLWGDSGMRDPESGECLLRVPPGSWEVTCSAKGYEDSTVRLDAAGPAEVRKTVALVRGADVEVRVRLDGRPWTGEIKFEIARSGSEDDSEPVTAIQTSDDEVRSRLVSRSTSTSRGGTTLDGIPPGEWTVCIGDVDGFEPLPPRTVLLERGTKLEVLFDLVRKK